MITGRGFYYGNTAWKVSKYGANSGPYFPVFGLNTEKYGTEITPYLDTFHAVQVKIFIIFLFGYKVRPLVKVPVSYLLAEYTFYNETFKILKKALQECNEKKRDKIVFKNSLLRTKKKDLS